MAENTPNWTALALATRLRTIGARVLNTWDGDEITGSVACLGHASLRLAYTETGRFARADLYKGDGTGKQDFSSFRAAIDALAQAGTQ